MHRLLNPLTNRTKTRIANAIYRLPIPLGAWVLLEKLSATAQGKGWGMSTIKEETSTCLMLLQKTPLVFADIGANIGVYTKAILDHSPHCHCHLFEPAAINIHRLRSRFANLPNVHVMPYALSDRHGSTILRSDSPGSGTASIMVASDSAQTGAAILETIQTRRMDNLWDSLHWPDSRRILDLVKIDVEGHELAVLDGFGEKINQTRVVQFEYGSRSIDTRTYFRDFWTFFKGRSFNLYRITPKGAQPIEEYSVWDESMVTTNFVALNQIV